MTNHTSDTNGFALQPERATRALAPTWESSRWWLLGAGIIVALGGLGWWVARQRAKGKCQVVLEWEHRGAKIIVEQCPLVDGFAFQGEVPQQTVGEVELERVTSPLFKSTDALREWAHKTIDERMASA
jgi:hypothetical protein